jgi:hypothetical protein
VFFELLQLKTWDYIDLDQDESYGDIKVSHCSKLFDIYVWASENLILSLSILHNRSCRV